MSKIEILPMRWTIIFGLGLFNKESCRVCGTKLIPTMNCDGGGEDISWRCDTCFNLEDVTHSHNLLQRIPSNKKKLYYS